MLAPHLYRPTPPVCTNTPHCCRCCCTALLLKLNRKHHAEHSQRIAPEHPREASTQHTSTHAHIMHPSAITVARTHHTLAHARTHARASSSRSPWHTSSRPPGHDKRASPLGPATARGMSPWRGPTSEVSECGNDDAHVQWWSCGRRRGALRVAAPTSWPGRSSWGRRHGRKKSLPI